MPIWGKLFNDFGRLKATQEYLEALTAKHYGNSRNAPVESNVGGSPETTGTWGDRRVALRLAQWISPEFALPEYGESPRTLNNRAP